MQQAPSFRQVIFHDDPWLADVIACLPHPILWINAERLFEVCPEVVQAGFGLHKNTFFPAEPYGVGMFVRNDAVRFSNRHPATLGAQEPSFSDFAQFTVRPRY